MKTFKDVMRESTEIDKEMLELMQTLGYKSIEEAAKDAEEALKLMGGM